MDESYRLAILTQFNCSVYEITISIGEIDSVKCVFRRKSWCRRIEKGLCFRIRASIASYEFFVKSKSMPKDCLRKSILNDRVKVI